jgi:hypothetical protein
MNLWALICNRAVHLLALLSAAPLSLAESRVGVAWMQKTHHDAKLLININQAISPEIEVYRFPYKKPGRPLHPVRRIQRGSTLGAGSKGQALGVVPCPSVSSTAGPLQH